MQRVFLPIFYEVGERIGILSNRTDKDDKVKTLVASFAVEGVVENLLSTYKELQFCRGAGQELLRLSQLFRRRVEGELKGEDPLDIQVHVSLAQVIGQANHFRTLLLEELFREPVFRVTQTAGYDTLLLLTRAEQNLPESARLKLRPEVVKEIQESGKCLAYAIPTASGFHILRALELIMVDHHNAVCAGTKIKRIDNWGKCISDLRNISDPAKPNPADPSVAKTVALLQQIKDSDRNLIMHPEVLLTVDEAVTLFKLCEVGIVAMADKLPVDKQQYVNKLASLGIGYSEVKGNG